jgi:plastocyanin
MAKAIIWILVFILIIIGAFFIFNKNDSSSSNSAEAQNLSITPSDKSSNETGPGNEEIEESIVKDTISPQTYTIEIKPSAFWFNPRTIRIQAGDTVTFRNNGPENHWPASNSHPTHRAYPDSNIDKCNTPEATRIFDACTPIGPGETYSFIFTQKGTWHYHDHLRASLQGTIVVE